MAVDLADEVHAGPRLARSALTAQLHATDAELSALHPRWLTLEQQAEGATLFQGEAWTSHVAAVRGSSGAAICTVSEGDALTALLPLRITSGAGGQVATGFGEPFQQYSDMLIAPGYDPAEALKLMLATLRAEARPDAIMLNKVRTDSALHAAISGLGPNDPTFTPSAHAGGAPFVDLGPYADFAEFHATVSFKSRKNLRNARNRLGRLGEVSVLVDDSGDGLRKAIAGSYAGRLDWLDREGHVSRAFADPAFPAFLSRLGEGTSDLGVLAVTIKAGDRPIAYQWGFVHHSRYYAYIASWAPEFEEFSPGKMIMEDILRACHARGIAVADFLMPASRYKFTWANEAAEVRDWSAPLTLRGRGTAFWNSRLRPALKSAYVKMPAPVRTLARSILSRAS